MLGLSQLGVLSAQCIMLCRGLVLQGMGRSEDALADFEAALVLEPGNLTFLGHRGACLRAGGQLAASAADFERVLAASPLDVTALSNRGCVQRACAVACEASRQRLARQVCAGTCIAWLATISWRWQTTLRQ